MSDPRQSLEPRQQRESLALAIQLLTKWLSTAESFFLIEATNISKETNSTNAFHPFPKLPRELRDRVWSLALPEPQYRMHSGPHGALFERPRSTQILALLHACSESRALTQRQFTRVPLQYWKDGMTNHSVVPHFGPLHGPQYEWVDLKNDVFAMRRIRSEKLVYYKGNAGKFLQIRRKQWQQVRSIAIEQLSFSPYDPHEYFIGSEDEDEAVTEDSVAYRLHATGICRRELQSLTKLYIVRYVDVCPFQPWLQVEWHNLERIVQFAREWFTKDCPLDHRSSPWRPSTPPEIAIADVPFPTTRKTAPNLTPSVHPTFETDDNHNCFIPSYYQSDVEY